MEEVAYPNAASAIREVIHERIAQSEWNTFGSKMTLVVRFSVHDIPALQRSNFMNVLRNQLLHIGDQHNLAMFLTAILPVASNHYHGWSMGTTNLTVSDLKNICVEGGVRFEDTLVQRTFVDVCQERLLRLKVARNITLHDSDPDCSVDEAERTFSDDECSAHSDDNANDSSIGNGHGSDDYACTEWWPSRSEDVDGGLRRIDMCACAKVNERRLMRFPNTTWCNGIITWASLPSYDDQLGYPTFTVANRDSAVGNLFRTALCQNTAQLLAANEMCGAWLSAFILGTKFSRIMVLDADTLLLETQRTPQPVKWKLDPPTAPLTARPDDDCGDTIRILPLKDFLNHDSASVDHMAHDLVLGWATTDWYSPVQLDDDALQTLLDFLGASILDIADASMSQLLQFRSTSHRAGPYLHSLAKAVEEWRNPTDRPGMIVEKRMAEELDMDQPTAIHADSDSLFPEDSLSERDEPLVESAEPNALDVVLRLPVNIVLVSPGEMDTAILERLTLLPKDMPSR